MFVRVQVPSSVQISKNRIERFGFFCFPKPQACLMAEGKQKDPLRLAKGGFYFQNDRSGLSAAGGNSRQKKKGCMA